MFEARLICCLTLLYIRLSGENAVIFTLGGVSTKALERFLSECQDIESIYIATDNDQAGNNAAEKLAELIPPGISVYRFLPQAKDWNKD